MIFQWLQEKFRLHLSLPSCGRTDPGRVRFDNEDCFALWADRDFYMVADGMGGHLAGEVASRMAVDTLADYFSHTRLCKMRGQPEEIHHALISGLRLANDRVMEMAAADVRKRGMGCTLVAALIDKRTLHTCHVGDVRCYLADDDSLEQITTDHSMAARVEANLENGAEPSAKINRSVVTRAIGFPFPEDPEYHTRQLLPGHKVLLCSDGLWSMVDDGEIHAILCQAASPEEACADLVEAANQAGGKDNITALVVFC